MMNDRLLTTILNAFWNQHNSTRSTIRFLHFKQTSSDSPTLHQSPFQLQTLTETPPAWQLADPAKSFVLR